METQDHVSGTGGSLSVQSNPNEGGASMRTNVNEGGDEHEWELDHDDRDDDRDEEDEEVSSTGSADLREFERHGYSYPYSRSRRRDSDSDGDEDDSDDDDDDEDGDDDYDDEDGDDDDDDEDGDEGGEKGDDGIEKEENDLHINRVHNKEQARRENKKKKKKKNKKKRRKGVQDDELVLSEVHIHPAHGSVSGAGGSRDAENGMGGSSCGDRGDGVVVDGKGDMKDLRLTLFRVLVGEISVHDVGAGINMEEDGQRQNGDEGAKVGEGVVEERGMTLTEKGMENSGKLKLDEEGVDDKVGVVSRQRKRRKLDHYDDQGVKKVSGSKHSTSWNQIAEFKIYHRLATPLKAVGCQV
jgi:hypothetical protein